MSLRGQCGGRGTLDSGHAPEEGDGDAAEHWLHGYLEILEGGRGHGDAGRVA
jgi:hypothetical protein